MLYAYLAAFIVGLLLAVRIMFFGAERRARRLGGGGMPLRRSEPALAAFLLMFGVAAYLLRGYGAMSLAGSTGVATVLGLAWAALVTRLAIAAARVQPENNPEDPRYRLQGHVAVVTRAIPAGGEGEIVFGEVDHHQTLRARSVDQTAVDSGTEVCIERVDESVAMVEPWALVEARL